jgi:hypothetical protein
MGAANELMPNVCRLARLCGGLIAVHNPGAGHADIATGLGVPVLARVTVPHFSALVHALESEGLRVLGLESIESELELNGASPPQWRAFCPSRGWTVYEAIRDWRERSFAAHKEDGAAFADLAARIAFGLAAAEERLRQTAVAYSAQLRGRQMRGELVSQAVFDDLHGLGVALAIHAAFYDFGAIRDAIAEFLARFVFKLGAAYRSWDMSKLVEALRSKSHGDGLADELLRITSSRSSPRGWLYMMSQYRNLFMHVAPLQFTRSTRFVVQEMQSFGALGQLPLLYHPLPADPEALKADRLARLRERGQRGGSLDMGQMPGRTSEPDALEYLGTTLLMLAEFAHMVAARAPYERMPIRLTDADLVGGVRIHRDGSPDSEAS